MTLMRELTEENEDNQGPFPECSYPFFSLAAFCRSFHLRSSATSICAVAGLLLSASTPATFAKGQKKSTASAQQKPEAILAAAKKFADAKAWSVQAHVNADKDMKISGIIFGKLYPGRFIRSVGRFTRSLPLSRPDGLPVYVARVPGGSIL